MAEYGVVVDYQCCKCGARDCKLWRQYSTFAPDLFCVDCAARDQPDHPVDDMDERGRRLTPEYDWLRGRRSYEIGWLVPAIPVDGEDAFWGYTSIPPDGLQWWEALPNRPKGRGAGGNNG